MADRDTEPTVIQFVRDGLGVAVLPEQITGLPHDGVAFRSVVPPLQRESATARRGDNSSRLLKDYIQIVKELSRSM
jgi:DNA-binding transcriptional LysR family regulator